MLRSIMFAVEHLVACTALRAPESRLLGLSTPHCLQPCGGYYTLLQTGCRGRVRAGWSAQDSEEGRVGMTTAVAILKFAAMRICSPLLSLIDSTVVGRFGTVSELADLVPGTIVCDSSAYVLTFLGISTTNLYATALAEGRPDEDFRVLNNALALEVLSGTMLAISIYFLAPYALVAFTGSSASDVSGGPSVCGNSGSGNLTYRGLQA
jgi:hypothetical protein